jgi:hypothetical protein
MESIVNTSRVSIITKSEIRYEGTLFKINPEVKFFNDRKRILPSRTSGHMEPKDVDLVMKFKLPHKLMSRLSSKALTSKI